MDGTTHQEAARIKYEINRQGHQQEVITEMYEKETTTKKFWHNRYIYIRLHYDNVVNSC